MRLDLGHQMMAPTRCATNRQRDAQHWNSGPEPHTFGQTQAEPAVTQPISKPVQKWAATMVMITLQLAVLAIIAVILMAWLPASYYGTILLVIAGLGIALSVLIGLVVRWLAAD